ncbi:hypothetical protein EPO05_01545 [Patescibacteria group bacterium]|nr:MAG: hypothetical protein EPO05_01545 [Patescibacteria group bacterium]
MEKNVTRIKKSLTFVPRSLSQANTLLGELGATQDTINEIEKALADEIRAIKAKVAKKLGSLVVIRDTQLNSLFAYANQNKGVLTEDRRSIQLTSGTFGWRWSTPRVEIDGTDAETIEMLKETDNERYIRIIEEVNRQLLLEEKPAIDGISYEQDEEFFAVPKQKGKKAKTLTHAIDR